MNAPTDAELTALAHTKRGAELVLASADEYVQALIDAIPDGDVDHSVRVRQDLAKRKRSRPALAGRNERLNAMVDLSPDGLLVFDTGRRLVSSNRDFLAMTGWPAAVDTAPRSLEDVDRRFARLCDPDNPPRRLGEALRAAHGATDTLTLLQPEVDCMKSESLSTAAHGFRTPMISVFGITELRLATPVSEARRCDMLETMHRQSQPLINMLGV